MYCQTNDQELFKIFWLDESINFPVWWSDATNSKRVSWQEFKDFCARMWRVYSIDDKALVFFEKMGTQAVVHFSLLRGQTVDSEPLIALRDEILVDCELIFGWCATKNRGLATILKDVGFVFDGLTMRQGISKVLEYKCYMYYRKTVAPCTKSLIG